MQPEQINRKILNKMNWLFILFFITTLSKGFSQATVFTVRLDGTILKSGQLFFPYGFYTNEHNDKPSMFNHVSITGKAGFNIMILEPYNNDSLVAIFNEAKNNGQYIIYNPTKYIQLPGLHAIYDKVKNQPNLFGYNIGDDVNDGAMTGYPANVNDVKILYDDLKVYDTKHLCQVALGNGAGRIEVFSEKRFDAGAEEMYPINGGSRINLVYSAAADVVSRSATWKQSPWIVLQTFNWNTNPTQRMPTPKEYYNMLYQSITAGVKGVILYTYHSGNTGCDSDIIFWNAIKHTAPEINQISPFLTNGLITKTDLGNGLYAATWELDNKVLAIVAHAGNYSSNFDPATNPPDTRNISLPLPAGTVGPATPAFLCNTGSSAGMSFLNGNLTGPIKLLDVHAYIFDKNCAPNSNPNTQIKLTMYPNPSNELLVVSYVLPKKSDVILNIINALGKDVFQVANRNQNEGKQSFTINTGKLHNGIYFVNLMVDGKQTIQKLIIEK